MKEESINIAAAQQRVIRVFISSTFRDMYAEREELVKRVLPKLRKVCEQRRVTWAEVDLRWGITEEEIAEGKVLPICLDEVDNCRPYFIALIGDRYGSVPDQYPDELLESHPWIKDNFDKSITELEILYGALNYVGTRAEAFFYLRDPAYPSVKADSLNLPLESDELHKKLSNLKERICNSGYPVRHYLEPVELGELLLKDFRELIDIHFHEDSHPSAFEQENAAHQAFAETLNRVYIPQENYLGLLEKHVASDGLPLVVWGDAGIGKSALLANWAWRRLWYSPQPLRSSISPRYSFWKRFRDLVRPPSPQQDPTEASLLMHFVGASARSTDWSAMLRRIMSAWKQRFALDLEIPDQPNSLRLAFAGWMQAIAEQGKVILLIDGLDQLEDHGQALNLAWLPSVVPSNVRLILSTAEGPSLNELRKRGWPTLEIRPLKIKDRERFVVTYLDRYRKRLILRSVKLIASASPSANPLYLRTLLEELRLFGQFEGLEKRIDYYLAANTIDELYTKVLARFEGDYESNRPGLVADAMRLLWVARHGLSENELSDLLGAPGSPLPNAIWSPLYLAAESSLVSRSGLLNFFHKDLRRAVEERYLSSEDLKRTAHCTLSGYFAGRELSPRKIEELPWHLMATQSWEELYRLLTNSSFLIAAWSANQFEVKSYWAAMEKESTLRMSDAYREIIAAPDENPVYSQIVCLLLTDTGNFEQALILSAHLERQARSSGIAKDMQTNLGLRAVLLRNRGDLTQALRLLEEQEHICRHTQDTVALAASIGSQGVILREQGKLDVAMARFREEERLCRQSGDLPGLSANLGNQGMILFDRDNHAAAATLFREQERICQQLGDLSGLQKSLGNQAVILTCAGDLKQAASLHAEEERLCHRLGDLAGLQSSLGNQALIREKLGDYDGAMELLDEKEKIVRRLGDPGMIARTLLQQSYLYAEKLRQPRYALPLAEEAHQIAIQKGLIKLEREIQMLLHAIHSRIY